MNPNYRIIFFIVFFLCHFNAQASVPSVKVSIDDLALNLSYQQPVRLSQVLSDTQNLLDKKNAQPTFWLAAQLLQHEQDQQILQLKNNLLKKLQDLGNLDPKTKLKAEILSTFINLQQFNYRHFISLDNDLVRIQADQDPLLTGAFTLLTPTRVKQIRIIGGTPVVLTAPLNERSTINDYLKAITLPENSNTSVVYIIQPDGTVNKNNNSYWNRTSAFFAPGASLFIGFKSLPAEYASLNEQIANLLRYMAPLTQGGKI